MSKVIATLVATGGATAATVGGAYMLQKSGEGEGKLQEPKANEQGALSGSVTSPAPAPAQPATPVKPAPAQPSASISSSTTEQNLEFETLETFKSDMKKSKCIKDYFGENMADKPDATQISTGAPDGTVFFKSTSTDLYKSCLTINGKINKYEGDKWNGKFTWLGAFVGGDEGFITFNIAETSDTDANKLKFSGIFYLVGKTESTSNWEVKYRHESKIDITADSTQMDTYFPKAGDDLKGSVEGDYWGFMDDKNKLDSMCKTSECGNAVTSGNKCISKKFSGTSKNDQTKKLSEGSSVSGWGSSIYDSTSGNLENKIDQFQGVGGTDSSSG